MLVKFIEIRNYRRLKSCRVELSPQKTLFVGANNSGKTSAMEALLKFLGRKYKVSTNDFTVSNWASINALGEKWIKAVDGSSVLTKEWQAVVPTVDVWIEVSGSEVHYVTHLLPSLEWNGELIGVRLSYEPKSVERLYKDFRDASAKAAQTQKAEETSDAKRVALWPTDMKDFLDRKLNDYFSFKGYTLDPGRLVSVVDGVASLQSLPDDEEPLEGNPLGKLICVQSIGAQRGFNDPDASASNEEDAANLERTSLSTQLRNYYCRHIDPEIAPDPKDLAALKAITEAQSVFDEKLKEGFASAIGELESMGYPGFTDPHITIATKVKPIDAMKHDSAVQYSVAKEDDDAPRLPERYNGLGYQNLISMVFRLINYRDDWMRVGKAAITAEQESETSSIQPLQLVLVEEPEAHLHAQVQQVFIRKAYGVLRNHSLLRDKADFSTQLVVSTHSGHIAHAVNFADLRYFKRRPASKQHEVPTSTVINLSEVFGTDSETARFVTRYLRATHCDLFFADAAIMLEGPTERMLLPHFIDSKFPKLGESYISTLEIGGCHAHRLRPLIEHLGLITLVVTDLDPGEKDGHHKAALPERGKELVTTNATLSSWLPGETSIDQLLDIAPSRKASGDNGTGHVRVAYQGPATVKFGGKSEEVLSRTFEDAFAVCNIDIFRALECDCPLGQAVSNAVKGCTEAKALKQALFEALDRFGSKKAEFALELLFLKEPRIFSAPQYMSEGLAWLSEQLEKQHADVILAESETNSKA